MKLYFLSLPELSYYVHELKTAKNTCRKLSDDLRWVLKSYIGILYDCPLLSFSRQSTTCSVSKASAEHRYFNLIASKYDPKALTTYNELLGEQNNNIALYVPHFNSPE